MTVALSPNTRITPTTRYLRRTLLSARWWHTWIGIFIGVFVGTWVTSGLIMLLPQSPVARLGIGTGKPIDWAAVNLSPAQAARLAGAGGTDVTAVEFKRIRDAMVYVVRVKRADPTLVDAVTGRVFTITDTMAIAIASDGMNGAPVTRVERVENPGGGFRGTQPSWHVVFGDPTGTEAYVTVGTGDVRRSSHGDRLQAALGGGVHLFVPLNHAPGGERSRQGALWLTSIVALLSVLTGYWLSLPRRWRSRV